MVARKTILTSEGDPPRPDPIAPWRAIAGPTTLKHIALMEKLWAHYVVSERDEQLAAEIQRMIESAMLRRDPSRPHGADNRREGSALVIVGASGSGKTKAMEHYLKDNPYFPNHGDPDGGCPLITVQVKAPTTLRQLSMSTLYAAGYLGKPLKQESEAWAQVRWQIEFQSIVFGHYEEAQRIIKQKNRIERGKIVETLAGLLTDTGWPISLILSGLAQIKKLFQDDFLDHPDPDEREAHITLKRRTRFVVFPPIHPKHDRKDLDKGVDDYRKLAGVSLDIAKEPEMRERICHAAARQLGLYFELTVLAIDACVRSGRKVVTLEDYADAYASMTTQPVELNVFENDHWRDIDTRIIQHRPDSDDEDDDKPKKTKPKKTEPRRSET
jgi:hypothetical protein